MRMVLVLCYFAANYTAPHQRMRETEKREEQSVGPEVQRDSLAARVIL